MLMKKTARGYMTVEAAFLVTWTMFVFVLLLYLSFYSYDKCVLFQDAYTVCFKGSIQKDEDQVVPYINAHMQKQFGKKYFGVGKVQGTVDQDGHTTSVTGECQVKVPIRQLFTMHDKAGWKIRTRAKAQIINPTKVIRKCRWRGLNCYDFGVRARNKETNNKGENRCLKRNISGIINIAI